MEYAADLWHLFVRLVRASVRMPVFVIVSIVQPIVWVLVFGQLFRSVARLPGFGASSYVQFLAPGIAVMTAMFGAAYSGLGMLGDIERGVLDRLLATPVGRGALLAARILHSAVQVSLQSAIILLVSAVVGARPHGGALGLALVLLAAALLGAVFASFSNSLALLTRRQELVIAAMNFVMMPAIFLSSMMMSGNLMPGWIRAVSLWNPVNWAVTAARASFEGQWQLLPRNLGLLAAFTVAVAWLATLSFRRYRHAG
jgi:ABC-2 type transport system permease protein